MIIARSPINAPLYFELDDLGGPSFPPFGLRIIPCVGLRNLAVGSFRKVSLPNDLATWRRLLVGDDESTSGVSVDVIFSRVPLLYRYRKQQRSKSKDENQSRVSVDVFDGRLPVQRRPVERTMCRYTVGNERDPTRF